MLDIMFGQLSVSMKGLLMKTNRISLSFVDRISRFRLGGGKSCGVKADVI